ncbi:MAG: hypothetical protein DRP79_07420 [Planctomycetota bacterium]|nr:MAG: hypothetical protein DRP79_07420 [Planctomycetota bacterium]
MLCFADLSFEFFFQVDYPITWISVCHDTTFSIQSVSVCDTRYRISALLETDHHTRLVIEAAGMQTDHATLFIIREEDKFTN